MSKTATEMARNRQREGAINGVKVCAGEVVDALTLNPSPTNGVSLNRPNIARADVPSQVDPRIATTADYKTAWKMINMYPLGFLPLN